MQQMSYKCDICGREVNSCFDLFILKFQYNINNIKKLELCNNCNKIIIKEFKRIMKNILKENK